MEKQAAQALGEEVLAAAVVAPRGTTFGIAARATGVNVAGAAGVLIADAVAAKRKAPTVPGDHRGFLYVAVGPTKLAFFELKRGIIKNSLGKLLVEVPRSEVVRFETESKGIASSPLDVELKDGTVYGLEVARVNRGKVEKVQQALAR